MMIHGIPEDKLERIHWYLGPGKGSEYADKHIPSGIMVGGLKPSDMKTHEFVERLFAELVEKLKAAGIITALIEIGECVFDQRQYDSSRGFESLDPIAQEAFVNHMHLAGETAAFEADRIVKGWASEMRARWPNQIFRIYRHLESSEITIRFHKVRPGLANWCNQGVEIITVNG
jgi:hypothetical protein